MAKVISTGAKNQETTEKKYRVTAPKCLEEVINPNIRHPEYWNLPIFGMYSFVEL